jgi:hypothetical protein
LMAEVRELRGETCVGAEGSKLAAGARRRGWVSRARSQVFADSGRSGRVGSERKTKEEMAGFLSFGGDAPDRKHASFRLMGNRLDPEAITSATGVTPSESHRKDEPSGRERGPLRWRSGIWTLESEHSMASQGNRLDDHLTWLLGILGPQAEAIRNLMTDQGLHADFWCYYSMGQANSGFGLTESTLRGIAALGADLSFDIYGERAETELEHWLGRAP